MGEANLQGGGIGQKIRITISETLGKLPTQYVQIMSEDGFSVNIVLIVTEVVLDDRRETES